MNNYDKLAEAITRAAKRTGLLDVEITETPDIETLVDFCDKLSQVDTLSQFYMWLVHESGGPGDKFHEAWKLVQRFNKELPSMSDDPEKDRVAYETFIQKRFGACVDTRRVLNGDQGYMAWDMLLGWIVWQYCNKSRSVANDNL